MFKAARIKLTIWYLAVIMSITLSFSLVVYKGVTEVTMRALEAQRRRVEKQLFMGRDLPFMVRGNPMIDAETILEIRTNTKNNLIVVNVVIFVVAGSLGYLLAGKTLQPIETMVKKQKRFISDAAHEIKTPLTAMKTTLEVALRDKNLSHDERMETMQSTIQEIDKLNLLASRLLSQSRHQNENNSHVEQISVKEAITKSVDKLKNIAKSKNLSLKTEITDSTINANFIEIEELFINLIDNAIKYSSPNDEIIIKAKQMKNLCVVSVEDNGKGISEEDLPHIFEPFYRADKSRTNSHTEGYGLGLAISKEIVDKYLGEIKINSALKKGTIVTVKFPISKKSVESTNI